MEIARSLPMIPVIVMQGSKLNRPVLVADA